MSVNVIHRGQRGWKVADYIVDQGWVGDIIDTGDGLTYGVLFGDPAYIVEPTDGEWDAAAPYRQPITAGEPVALPDGTTARVVTTRTLRGADYYTDLAPVSHNHPDEPENHRALTDVPGVVSTDCPACADELGSELEREYAAAVERIRDRVQLARYGGRWLRFFTIDPRYSDMSARRQLACAVAMASASMGRVRVVGDWPTRPESELPTA